MVYVDPKNLGYQPYWTRWCTARGSDKEQEELNRLYEKYVPVSIDLILEGILDGKEGKKLKTIIPLTNLNMVSVVVYVRCTYFPLICYFIFSSVDLVPSFSLIFPYFFLSSPAVSTILSLPHPFLLPTSS